MRRNRSELSPEAAAEWRWLTPRPGYMREAEPLGTNTSLKREDAPEQSEEARRAAASDRAWSRRKQPNKAGNPRVGQSGESPPTHGETARRQ